MTRKLPSVHEYHLRGCFFVTAAIFALLLGLAGAVAFAAWKIDDEAPAGYSGNPRRGKNLIVTYGCPSCHVMHDVASPRGLVGPPLDDMAKRAYIAGRFANDEIWMMLWLQNPQRLAPGNGMPDLRVSERDARDLAAYLATLR
jgi:cytochrome c